MRNQSYWDVEQARWVAYAAPVAEQPVPEPRGAGDDAVVESAAPA